MISLDRHSLVDKHFRESLLLKGYHVVDVEPDGNCQFTALSLALFGPGMNHQMKIRMDVYNHIRNNALRLLQYVEYDERPGMTEMDILQAQLNAVERIKLDKSWGCFGCLKAASELYGRTIVVEQPLLEAQRIGPPNAQGDEIILSYHNRNHYNFLHKIHAGCCDKVVVDLSSQETYRLVDTHFKEYLRLKDYELTEVDKENSPYNVISMVLYADNGDNHMEVRSAIQNFIFNNLSVLRDLLQDHVRESRSLASEEQLQNAVTDYIADITISGKAGDLLSVDVASRCFKRMFVVERPLKQPIYYGQGDSTNGTIYLSCNMANNFNLLRKRSQSSTLSISNADEEVIKVKQIVERKSSDEESQAQFDLGKEDCVLIEDFVVPFIRKPNITKADEKEGLYMLRNFHLSARSKVNVVFLFPEPNLQHRTLVDVIKDYEQRGESVPFLKFAVIYNDHDFADLKKDADLREVYTLYATTLSVPSARAFYERTKWLSNLIIVPLLLTMKRRRWRGIRLHALTKYSKQSILIQVFTKAWGYCKHEVKQCVTTFEKDMDKFLCFQCSPECRFKDYPCHWNASEFLKLEYTEATSAFFMERFDLFASFGDGAPSVSQKILHLYWENSSEMLENLYSYLDSINREEDLYYSYMVLHMDGPNMEDFHEDSYYAMLQDDNIYKSIYVGSTINEDYRSTHALDPRSSLFKVLTKSSRLFLLRSIEFKVDILAREDEARVIEVLAYYLKVQRDKKRKREFLLLNRRAECMKLVQTPQALTQDLIDFCNSGIPIYRTKPTQTKTFKKGIFKGNYKFIRELAILKGEHSSRQFTDTEVQNYYHEVTKRQP